MCSLWRNNHVVNTMMGVQNLVKFSVWLCLVKSTLSATAQKWRLSFIIMVRTVPSVCWNLANLPIRLFFLNPFLYTFLSDYHVFSFFLLFQEKSCFFIGLRSWSLWFKEIGKHHHLSCLKSKETKHQSDRINFFLYDGSVFLDWFVCE